MLTRVEAVIPRFIQNTLFGSGDIRVINGGYKSDVILFSHARQIVIKVIGGKKDIQLTFNEAAELGRRISHYRQLVKTLGIPVPGSMDWVVNEDSDTGLVYLYLIEPYTGTSPEDILKRCGPSDARWIAKQIMTTTEPLFFAQPHVDGFLEVGLDPKTNNYTIGTGGEFSFVDFMPPRYRQDDGTYLVEYPALSDPQQVALWKWKHFTLDGLVSVTLYQLGRFCIQFFQEVKDCVRNFLIERKSSISLEPLDILDNLSPREIRVHNNPYYLRLMMCELASKKGIGSHVVEDFFQKTHFEGYFPPKALEWAHDQLVDLC